MPLSALRNGNQLKMKNVFNIAVIVLSAYIYCAKLIYLNGTPKLIMNTINCYDIPQKILHFIIILINFKAHTVH